MLDAPDTTADIVLPAVVRAPPSWFIDCANRPRVWESASDSPIERPPASCAVPAELPAPGPPPLPPSRDATPPEAANEDRTAAPEEVPGSTNANIRNTTSGHTAPIRISMADTSAMPTAAAFLSPLPETTPWLILTPMPSTRAASGEISEAEMNQRQDFQNQVRPISAVSPAAEIAEVVAKIIRAAHRASWMNTYPSAAGRTGSLNASMIRKATASAHMDADHNATMAPFHPSAVATAAASPSQLMGLKLPRSMPNAGGAAISVRPCSVAGCRAGLLTSELLVSGVDGCVGAWPDGRRRGRLSAGPDHPAARRPGHALAVGHGDPGGPCQGGVDLEVHAGHHPVASVGGLDQPHQGCGAQGKVGRPASRQPGS